MGADRARLRELGTVEYKTYGALKDYREPQLRSLISQMVEEGYLYQTQEQYSVLKMGNIAPLRDENTRVMMRVYQEKRRRGVWTERNLPTEARMRLRLPAMTCLRRCESFGWKLPGRSPCRRTLFSMTRR